jgi:phospholipid/cholesterol/gamma-HCH transport system substrate-binding protein
LDITNNLKVITDKIRSGDGTVGRLVNDDSLSRELLATVNNFGRIAGEGKQSMANIENFTERMNAGNSSINKLFADTVLFDSVRETITQLHSATETMNAFVNNMNSFSANLKTTGTHLQDTNTTAGMLLYDKRTADSLRIIINNLTSASKKLDEDLEAVRHNFLLKGYFKHEQAPK